MVSDLKIVGDRCRLVTFINPYSYLILRKNGLLEQVRDNFQVCYDGISLVLLSRIFGGRRQRESFDDTSLAPMIFEDAKLFSRKIGIIGGRKDVVIRSRDIINRKYDDIVRFSFDGYLTEREVDSAIKDLAECYYVICSMGTPRQELLLLKLKEFGWQGDGFTCGGYLDQLTYANGNEYYPKIFNRLNLRWLYRLYKEPRRLWRRYLIDYPMGMFFFVIDGYSRNFNDY